MAWSDYQFGDRIPGKNYRERSNGDRVNNWNVEIDTIFSMTMRLFKINVANPKLASPCLDRSVLLLQPWLNSLDSNLKSNVMDKNQIDRLLSELVETERFQCAMAQSRNDYSAALIHCEHGLVYAKRFRLEGELKVIAIFTALSTFIEIKMGLGHYSEAVVLSEEAYNIVAIFYNPVHQWVQAAAGYLIMALTNSGNYKDAERFAEQTLANLRDPRNGADPKSIQVADGAANLADAILRAYLENKKDVDIVKAEKLAREALVLREKWCGRESTDLCKFISLLANVLMAQKKLGDETKGLFERTSSICLHHEGPYGSGTAGGYCNLGQFYNRCGDEQVTPAAKKEQYKLAKKNILNAVNIVKKINGPDHPNTIGIHSILGEVNKALKKLENQAICGGDDYNHDLDNFYDIDSDGDDSDDDDDDVEQKTGKTVDDTD